MVLRVGVGEVNESKFRVLQKVFFIFFLFVFVFLVFSHISFFLLKYFYLKKYILRNIFCDQFYSLFEFITAYFSFILIAVSFEFTVLWVMLGISYPQSPSQ